MRASARNNKRNPRFGQLELSGVKSRRNGARTVRQRWASPVTESRREDRLDCAPRRQLSPPPPVRKTARRRSAQHSCLGPDRLQHLQARFIDRFKRKLCLKPFFRGRI